MHKAPGIVTIGALVTLSGCAGASGGHKGWEELLPQHENRDYMGKRPRTRYSHTATEIGDEVIIAFGYFYDHWDKGGATWHPDIWGLATKDVSAKKLWRLITQGAGAGFPAPRMNHVAIKTPSDKLMIYGGTGLNDEKFKDVWDLDVKTGAWSQRTVAPGKQPEGRNCFTGTLMRNSMFVYGGFHLGDLWRFDLADNTWSLVMDHPEKDHKGHPGKRAAHSAVASATGDGMYMYGGFRFENDVSDTSLGWGKLEDLWFYSALNNQWTLLEQVGGTQGGVQFFGMDLVPWWKTDSEAAEPDGYGLAVYGGTKCNPKCNLAESLTVYSLDNNRWYHVNVEKPPLYRYHHVMSYAAGAVWVHGGESFAPHMYHNAISKFAWPPPKDWVVELSTKTEGQEL